MWFEAVCSSKQLYIYIYVSIYIYMYMYIYIYIHLYTYTSIHSALGPSFLVLHRVSERQFVVLRHVAKAYVCRHTSFSVYIYIYMYVSLCVSTWSLCQQQAALYTSKFEDLCVLRHGAGQRECEEVGQDGP